MKNLCKLSINKVKHLKKTHFFILFLIPFFIFSQCVEGDCDSGEGRYKFKNGMYSGKFFDGEIEGEGVFETKKGYSYKGFWKNGQKNGFGVERLRKGEVYEGQFKSNYRDGHGEAELLSTRFMKNINYAGQWEKGSICGQGALTYTREVRYGRVKKNEENRLSGIFFNGVYQGRLTQPYADELIWTPFNLLSDHFQFYKILLLQKFDCIQ